MRKSVAAICLLSLVFLSWSSFGQENYFRFKISETGIYKLTASQAEQIGLPLNEVAIFGYPGMLPQQLDSSQLSHQEIPTSIQGQELWVYLEGPHQTELTESKQINYQHHLFSDSLSYLLGRKSSPKRVQELNPKPNQPDTDWYQFTAIKGETINILNSGRTWYSPPIRQNQSFNIQVNLSSGISRPWLISGKLMAQSFSPSTMRILTGNDLLAEIPFEPIPNTTYGIKGQEMIFEEEINPTSGNLGQIRFTFQGSSGNDAGHLDYLVIGKPVNGENPDLGLVASATAGSLQIPSGRKAWEVSDFFNPLMTNELEIVGKKFFVFDPDELPSLSLSTNVALSPRLTSEVSLVIITPVLLQNAARKLQAHKEALGIPTAVWTTNEIYDAFGYGNPDISAIRNAIAHQFHFKGGLQNVLILGKGTFDYKGKLGGRPNLVPTYTSRNSLNPLQTYSSDDYFGLVDWGQGVWEESREGDELLQIGIGRIPAINFSEANAMIDKIIAYENLQFELSTFPSFVLLADDADNNIHMRDSENHAEYLRLNHPEIKTQKIYIDALEQIQDGNRQRSPDAKKVLEEQLRGGPLVLNYVGHGNETTLAAEEIFTVSDIPDWPSQSPPALWVTATCEFGRHDSPFLRSGAEELLFAPAKGAIGLLTTGRPVFSSVNFQLNQEFVKEVFKKSDSQNQDLGTIYRHTKNQSLNGVLNRNFSLLGDPSMKLARPELTVKVNGFFNPETGATIDTLIALEEVELIAEIIDPMTGSNLIGFNGEFTLELIGPSSPSTTLGDESSPFEFSEEKPLFRGRGTVENGALRSRIFFPNQLLNELEAGNVRILAWDESSRLRAIGQIAPLITTNPTPPMDENGPEIALTIEGQSSGKFVFNSTQLKVNAILSDLSGIQISGKIPGQDLYLKVNDGEPLLLNEYFFASNGNYQEGELEILVSGFQEGLNQLKIGAWDNLGNGSELNVSIEIRGTNEVKILDHKAFPNPASSDCDFTLRHNRPGENIQVSLEVFSLTGQILFSESKRFVRAENEISVSRWFFLQNQTKYPVKGTYIYRLSLISEQDNSSDSVGGKILIR